MGPLLSMGKASHRVGPVKNPKPPPLRSSSNRPSRARMWVHTFWTACVCIRRACPLAGPCVLACGGEEVLMRRSPQSWILMTKRFPMCVCVCVAWGKQEAADMFPLKSSTLLLKCTSEWVRVSFLLFYKVSFKISISIPKPFNCPQNFLQVSPSFGLFPPMTPVKIPSEEMIRLVQHIKIYFPPLKFLFLTVPISVYNSCLPLDLLGMVSKMCLVYKELTELSWMNKERCVEFIIIRGTNLNRIWYLVFLEVIISKCAWILVWCEARIVGKFGVFEGI